VQESPVLTVTQLNRLVRHCLENDMGTVRIEGEISNAMQASSGHCYFTLKDASAQIRCVYFKNRYTVHAHTPPTNGQLVIATGKLSVYEARGDYQLIVESLNTAGLGELFRAYTALKNKLSEAGLFDASRKKALPSLPQCIGIITSPNGAALHDIMTTITRRYPLARTQLYPSEVQGTQAAAQLIHAINQANHDQQCDVLILARGGGSLEDLWPFNNEALAYAIADSQLPIVSGVGHETDFTIADFVADLRAATPTAAAEAVTPDWQQFTLLLDALQTRLQAAMQRILQRANQTVQQLSNRLIAPQRRIDAHWQTLDYLRRHLHQALQQHLIQKQHALSLASSALNSLSPLATLARGYAIASHDDHVLLSSSQVELGESIQVQLATGKLSARVEEIAHA
jgi:exodeoxyribonuclease VII large subunit